jgi:hypothetical protein
MTEKSRDNREDAKGENLLWGWVVDKFDALLDIPLQTLLARFEELLLVRADMAENVFHFLGTRGLETC